MAVLAGALESVRLHLLSENDVDARDEKGRSPLMLAASRGHLDVCRLLLEVGADPALKDNEGNDAIAMALLSGKATVAALLQGVKAPVSTHGNGKTDGPHYHAPESGLRAIDAEPSPAMSLEGNERFVARPGETAEKQINAGSEVKVCGGTPRHDNGPVGRRLQSGAFHS
jgi:RNA polymerase primary sigma factor